jgi:hypothetical protein
MEDAVGIMIAAGVGLFANAIGFDKERCFYPVVLIVIATYYILFAAMANSSDALFTEAVPMVVFIAAAGIGFRRSAWIVVAGLALHGVFDFFHHAVITNPGVPAWWPGFCLAYDVTAAFCLSVIVVVRRGAHPS